MESRTGKGLSRDNVCLGQWKDDIIPMGDNTKRKEKKFEQMVK